MDGNTLQTTRESRNQTPAEFAKAIADKLGKKITDAKVLAWESGKDKIPAEVDGYVTLTNLVFTPPEKTKAVSVSVSNRKGGIGKTSISVNLAYVLAHAGAKVLLVDADSQSMIHDGEGIGF